MPTRSLNPGVTRRVRMSQQPAGAGDGGGMKTQELVDAIKALIEAGDGIRCYPSGAVGFDDWYEERDKAQLLIDQWMDEDGTWRKIDANT